MVVLGIVAVLVLGIVIARRGRRKRRAVSTGDELLVVLGFPRRGAQDWNPRSYRGEWWL